MIEIDQLTKRYKKLVALDRLSLEVHKGDLFGFIGPNGAGKTTTLKILATLLKPDAGVARVCGLDVQLHGRKVRGRIGYMPDFFGIYDEMKVTEYLDFFGAAYGIPAKERRPVIGEVLELTDLSGKKNSLIQELSRGMQQRLGLARVLVHDPEVLLLDEPASGLDPRARIEFKAILKELSQMGKTILISSHILTELSELCNRVAIIEQGRLLYCGSVKEVIRQIQPNPKYHLRVRGDLNQAQNVALGLGVTDLSMADSTLTLSLPEEDFDIAELSRALFENGLPVTHLTEQEIRLEEVFMRFTKGEVH